MFWSNYMGLLLWKGIENFKERYFLKVRLHANDDYFEAVTRIRNGCRFRVPSFNHKYKQMLRVFLKYWYIKRIEFPLCGEKFHNLSHWFSFYAQIIRCLYVASKIAGEGRGVLKERHFLLICFIFVRSPKKRFHRGICLKFSLLLRETGLEDGVPAGLAFLSSRSAFLDTFDILLCNNCG